MSPNDNNTGGWRITPEEEEVPVNAMKSDAPAVEPEPAEDVPMDLGHQAPRNVFIQSRHQESVDPRRMTLSAVMGIVMVLGGVGFYFYGNGNILRGDLTGGSTTTVSITAEGTFSPDSMNVTPGQSITLENKNKDPQVIKSKNGRELFPVQVLFDTPYTFTVPADAMGPYVYFSETLPDDKTITFNVSAAAASATTTTETPAQTVASDFEIPIPFGDSSDPIIPVVQETQEPAPVQPVEHSNETATISLGGNATPSTPTSPSAEIPTNPYTVESGLAKEKESGTIATTTKENKDLHSGAPLLTQKPRPKANTATGPAGAFMLLIPALLAMVFAHRKIGIGN